MSLVAAVALVAMRLAPMPSEIEIDRDAAVRVLEHRHACAELRDLQEAQERARLRVKAMDRLSRIAD